jgi:hypothetical protein
MIFAINSAKLRNLAAHWLLYTAVMNKVLAAVLALPLAACVVGSSAQPGGGGDDGTGGTGGTGGSDTGSGGTGGMTGISGHITADTSWTDTVLISGNVTIDPGVTVTVAPGATVNVAGVAGITVSGTLAISGTAASHATIQPATGTAFQAIDVATGGSVTGTFASVHGAEIQLNGGSLTLTDSKVWGAPGDLLVMNGGTINVTYTNIGDATSDTTHCNMHFGGTTPNNITIEHNNIVSRPYGLMFYSGTNADFKNNNWTNQIDIEPGISGVTGDASGSYFAKGQPSGTTGITYGTLSTAALPDAGPRG